MAARTARTAVGHRRRLRDQVGPLMAQTRLTAASPRKETVSTSHHGRLSTPGEAGRRLAGIEYRITSRSELDGHAGVLEHLPLAQAERFSLRASRIFRIGALSRGSRQSVAGGRALQREAGDAGVHVDLADALLGVVEDGAHLGARWTGGLAAHMRIGSRRRRLSYRAAQSGTWHPRAKSFVPCAQRRLEPFAISPSMRKGSVRGVAPSSGSVPRMVILPRSKMMRST
jgi:hypothetical protein